MKLKKITVVTAIIALLIGNAISVSAAVNKAQYGYAYVTKFSDIVTEYLTKVNPNDAASNLVGSVEGGRNLCSWCENSLGRKVTNTASYNSGDPVYMSYTTEVTAQVPARLVISTILTNFQDTGTFGYWSPDYITTY